MGGGRLGAASERVNGPATVALGSLCLDDEYGKDFGCDALGRGKIRGWVEKAAASGDGDSMALLGYWLLSGADGSGDAAGVKWLERAAQKDVPEAVGALALRMMMLDRREEAGRWFARLAGMTDRPDLLGVVALYYGKGIAPVAGENEVASEVRRLGWLAANGFRRRPVRCLRRWRSRGWMRRFCRWRWCVRSWGTGRVRVAGWRASIRMR